MPNLPDTISASEIYLKIDVLPISEEAKSALKQDVLALEESYRAETEDPKLEIEKMREDQHFFTRLYGNLYDAVVIYDYAQDLVLDCNDAMIKLLGYSKEDLEGGIILNDIIPKTTDLWPGVDLHAIVASHRGLVESGETFASPGIFVCKSGDEVIADVSVIPLYPERGIGFAVVKDMTQQALSRRALAASEEKYRRVFENSPMAIVNCRLDGFIEMASPSVSDVVGYAADEIVGMNMLDFVIEEDWPRLLASVDIYIAEKIAQESAFRISSKDGMLKYLRGIGVPVINEEGRIVTVINMFFDDTEFVQARQQARLLERHYTQIFEVSPAPIISTDFKGRIQLASPSFEKILGYQQGELVGKSEREIVIEEDWPKLEEARKHYRETAETYRAHYHCRTKQGEIKILESEGFSILGEDGRIESVANVFLDNTQLYMAQKALLNKNEELQSYISSNIQLEQFAHIASHDLKTPLRTVGSFTGLLRRKLGDRLDDKEQEFFDYIEQGTAQMASLINDLLRYSKVNSQELERTGFNVAELLGNVIRDLDFIIKESGAQITYDIADQQIVGDASRLRQVFQNLIANAIKFRKPETPCLLEVVLEESEKDWTFLFRDNGIGILPEFHETIFERFTHLHSNDEYEGTGMGLAICRKTIQQHGGTIRVESEIGQGSTFIFSVPKI